MSNKKTLRATLLTALLIMSGCAHTVGHDFPRPEQAGVVLGQTAEADILGRYGPPSTRVSSVNSGTPIPGKQPSLFDTAQVAGALTFLRYNYVLNQPPIAGGDMNQKGVVFSFWNGVLVAYDFSSSFIADGSDFDEDTAQAALAPRQLTRDDVIARFGPPGGRFVFPLTPTPGVERLRYSYQKFDRQTRQHQAKSMDIVFNAAGQMLDYRAVSSSSPFTPVTPVTRGGGLLILPAGRVGGAHR